MRFLNTRTFHFEEVPDSKLADEENKYAILSHRWGATLGEVSFADINESRDVSHKHGAAKLKGFCDLAASLGYHYGWMDTCCINKGDSSELTEAINSMYRWYQGSSLCVVYLEDVPEKPMTDSEWFKRGWTLQELIGPKDASFYDRDWICLGTKNGLLADICRRTGIPKEVLSHANDPSTCSIAQRMAWAAERETSRVEDRAYSLLGIFGVSMPQIYGEREKAYLRLQRAIIQQSKDESIFAWSMGAGEYQETYSGLFAPSPLSFLHCSATCSIQGSSGFTETNGELAITMKTFPHSMETYYAVLNCTEQGFADSRVAILLTRISAENDYVRVNKGDSKGRTLVAKDELKDFTAREIRVSLQPTKPPPSPIYGFWLRTLEPPGYTDCQIKILANGNQSATNVVCLDNMQWGTAGVVHFESKINRIKMDKYSSIGVAPSTIRDLTGWSKIHWIKLGFDRDFNPMLYLANDRARLVNMRQGLILKLPTEQLLEQAITAGLKSRAHKEVFDNRWINFRAGVPSRIHGWYSGMSVVKTDKKTGIFGALDALNLGISIQLVYTPSDDAISSKQKDSGSRLVWAVDITETKGLDPEQSLKDADRHISSQEAGDLCIACCCGGQRSYAGQQMLAERTKHHNFTKVLGASDLNRNALASSLGSRNK